MFWKPGQPAIHSDGRILPNHPISVPMPIVQPPLAMGVDPQIVRDLVLLLLKATRKLALDDDFRKVVLDYLHRKDLQPSPLREGASS